MSEKSKGTNHYLLLAGRCGIGKYICTYVCAASRQGLQEGIEVPVSLIFHFILLA